MSWNDQHQVPRTQSSAVDSTHSQGMSASSYHQQHGDHIMTPEFTGNHYHAIATVGLPQYTADDYGYSYGEVDPAAAPAYGIMYPPYYVPNPYNLQEQQQPILDNHHHHFSYPPPLPPQPTAPPPAP